MSGACERANGRASSLVLTSGFFIDLAHCEWALWSKTSQETCLTYNIALPKNCIRNERNPAKKRRRHFFALGQYLLGKLRAISLFLCEGKSYVHLLNNSNNRNNNNNKNNNNNNNNVDDDEENDDDDDGEYLNDDEENDDDDKKK